MCLSIMALEDCIKNIMLFISIIVLCGTDNIPHNIPHIKIECENNIHEYVV